MGGTSTNSALAVPAGGRSTASGMGVLGVARDVAPSCGRTYRVWMGWGVGTLLGPGTTGPAAFTAHDDLILSFVGGVGWWCGVGVVDPGLWSGSGHAEAFTLCGWVWEVWCGLLFGNCIVDASILFLLLPHIAPWWYVVAPRM
jgi:hypothetical protein